VQKANHARLTDSRLTVRPYAVVWRGMTLLSLGCMVGIAGSIYIDWRARHGATAGRSLIAGPWQVGVSAACLLGALLLVTGIGYLSSFVTVTEDRVIWRWHFVRSEVELADVVGVTLARPRSSLAIWAGVRLSETRPARGSVLHLVHRRKGAVRIDPLVIRRSTSTAADAARVCEVIERAMARGVRRSPGLMTMKGTWTASKEGLSVRLLAQPMPDGWVPPLRAGIPGRPALHNVKSSHRLGPFEPQVPTSWN